MSESDRRRVEIVHESLLSNWPRLVRWRAQDEEGAVLRDQLRQAAQLWDQHGRAEDFLWTGTAFREYQLWRERYSGGLTALEDQFAAAMASAANRRRRRRRLALAGAFALLLAVLAVVGLFWSQSERSRRRAEEEALRASAQARRAEAAKLLALAQLEADGYPTAALAYATKSLEISDSREARLFALRILQQAPVATVLTNDLADEGLGFGVAFSPDGEWLAMGSLLRVRAWRRAGGAGRGLAEYPPVAGIHGIRVAFPSDDLLVANRLGHLKGIALASGEPLWEGQVESGPSGLAASAGGLVTLTTVGDREELHRWRLPDGEPRKIGSMEPLAVGELDPSNEWLAYARGASLFVRPLGDWSRAPRKLHEHPRPIAAVAWHPSGDRIALLDDAGAVVVLPAAPPAGRPLVRYPELGRGLHRLAYDATGRWLAAGGAVAGYPKVLLRDTQRPAEARPVTLDGRHSVWLNDLAFSRDGKWLATSNVNAAALWPVAGTASAALEGHATRVTGLAFSPDGERLYSASNDTVRAWSIPGSGRSDSRVLYSGRVAAFAQLDVDERGETLAVAGAGGRIVLVPTAGGEARVLHGFSDSAGAYAVRFTKQGRALAAGVFTGLPGDKGIRIWDLGTGTSRIFPLQEAPEPGFAGGVWAIDSLPDGRLLVGFGSEGGRLDNKLVILDPQVGTTEVVATGLLSFALQPDGKGLVALDPGLPPRLATLDLATGDSATLTTHGADFWCLAIDATGKILATGSLDGTVRVGSLSGDEPHLLLGHEGLVRAVAISPDGRWVASAGEDATVRLWPMPDLSKPPLHTLPHDQLLAKLKALTNLRVVEDFTSPTGYKLDVGPFPGWERVPEW